MVSEQSKMNVVESVSALNGRGIFLRKTREASKAINLAGEKCSVHLKKPRLLCYRKKEPDASETGEEFRDMITMTQKGKLKNEKTVRPKANESRPGSAFSFLKGFT
jgi:hypothetical protein